MTSARLENLMKKAAKYCAWQERCSFDVRKKYIDQGFTPGEIEKLVEWLKTEKYIDDARFAKTYARSKFNNNQWGRKRIMMELKSRDVDASAIDLALNEIKEKDYLQTIEKLAEKKWQQIKTGEIFIKKQKTAAFLVNKGFETDLAIRTIDRIERNNP